MRSKWRAAVVLATFLLSSLGGVASADPYPIGARYLTPAELPLPIQPWLHATGNLFCGQLYSGGYGTGHIFSNAEIKVNYGGTCNAAWPRPANNLAAHIQIYVGYAMAYNLSALNTANTSVVQRLSARYIPATAYIFQASIFDGTNWKILGRCVGSNCGI